MPSPFPGMNPYIEHPYLWKDFHQSFMPMARETIASQVSPHYYVKVEEHIYLHERSADERRILGLPDLSVHSRPDLQPSSTRNNATKTLAPSAVLIPEAVEEENQSYLEIRDRESNRVVTIVELLSPSNKDPGKDRDQYWTKVQWVLRTKTNFVEIDLLRGFPRLPWLDMPVCDYYALVSRFEERPHVDFWPIQLRDALPSIPIPLQPGEPEANLDLQTVLNRVYDSARYETYIYKRLLEPPLKPEDAAWAAAILESST